MSFGPQNYVPCVRWKQGEYQALFRLSSGARGSMVPLIEVPEIGFDFETRKLCKSVDDHLSTFAKRVREKWGKGHCLVDIHLVGSSHRMANGQHPFAFVFDDLRSNGVVAIPVAGFSQDTGCQSAIEAIVRKDVRGLGIRVNIEEATKGDLAASLKRLTQQYRVGVEECDIVLDVGAPNFVPIEGFGALLETVIGRVPQLDRWRSFALIGTSFPSSLTGLKQGSSIIPRNEWKLHKFLVTRLKALGVRIPTFGDYGINHPAILPIDMRLAKPFASVRYTIDDGWLIVKGPNVRDHGYGQYRKLCQTVVDSKHYSGPTFSSGDKDIWDCAQGTASTGNLTTWRRVGTNHHLEKVTRDVANLSDS